MSEAIVPIILGLISAAPTLIAAFTTFYTARQSATKEILDQVQRAYERGHHEAASSYKDDDSK